MQDEPVAPQDGDSASHEQLDGVQTEIGPRGEVEQAKTTLVEVAPGMAVVLGEVPRGLELVDFGVVPSFDRVQLNQALGTVGNVATITGNIAEAAASAQGLFRVNDATLALLKSGGEMAAKDGAKLGAIFKNGELVAQARFIPASMTVGTAIAAIGPAVAMLAMQMQLSEISSLVQANIQLTSNTLKAIRHDQWSELTGLSTAIDRAVSEASRVQAVSPTIWDSVSGSSALLEKELDQYRLNVGEHIKQLGKVRGTARRQYLEDNAEAILFDTNALLVSLKAHTGYQALRAARARSNAEESEHEAKLVEEITADTRAQFESSMAQAAQLVKDLTRELRIIAELPGRAVMPLTKKKSASKGSRLTCEQLLKAIQPLADSLNPPVPPLQTPDVVCMPGDLDLDQYLRVLRWFIDDDESLDAVGFPYEPGAHNLVGVIPAALGARVDATWSALEPGKRATVIDKVASPTLVAVTDRRIISASPRALATQGEIRDSIPLAQVQFVRPRTMQTTVVRPTVDVITEQRNIRWMFPEDADTESIDLLSEVIDRGATGARSARALSTGGQATDSQPMLLSKSAGA